MNILKILKSIFSVGKIVFDNLDPDLKKSEIKSLISTPTPTILPVDKKIIVSHKLPKESEWIYSIGTLPKTMEIIFSFCGLLEYRGKDNNPTIINWAKELGLSSIYNQDSIAWCGLGQGVGVKRADYIPPKNLLAAKSWANYGIEVKRWDARFGDIVVLNRDNNPALGHVTRLIGFDTTGKYFQGYGANQSDSWNFAWFTADRIHAIRRDPFKIGMPASMRKYTLERTGKLSKNEA